MRHLKSFHAAVLAAREAQRDCVSALWVAVQGQGELVLLCQGTRVEWDYVIV